MTSSFFIGSCFLCFVNSKVELCISSRIHHVEKPHQFFRTLLDGSVIIQHKSDVDQPRAKARLIESNRLDCVG